MHERAARHIAAKASWHAARSARTQISLLLLESAQCRNLDNAIHTGAQKRIVMGDEQDALALLAQLGNDPSQTTQLKRVKAGARLVKYQIRGIEHEHSRNGNATLLAAGIAKRTFLLGLIRVDAHCFKRCRCPDLRLVIIQAQVQGPKEHIVKGRLRKEGLLGTLIDISDFATIGVLHFARGTQAKPVKAHCALFWQKIARKRVCQRRLAAAARPCEPQHATGFDAQRHTVQDTRIAARIGNA